MAEIEIGVLDRQCLDRRIPRQEILEQETGAWEHRRTVGRAFGWTGASPPQTPASSSCSVITGDAFENLHRMRL